MTGRWPVCAIDRRVRTRRHCMVGRVMIIIIWGKVRERFPARVRVRKVECNRHRLVWVVCEWCSSTQARRCRHHTLPRCLMSSAVVLPTALPTRFRHGRGMGCLDEVAVHVGTAGSKVATATGKCKGRASDGARCNVVSKTVAFRHHITTWVDDHGTTGLCVGRHGATCKQTRMMPPGICKAERALHRLITSTCHSSHGTEDNHPIVPYRVANPKPTNPYHTNPYPTNPNPTNPNPKLSLIRTVYPVVLEGEPAHHPTYLDRVVVNPHSVTKHRVDAILPCSTWHKT